jgi:hypothetical protein
MLSFEIFGAFLVGIVVGAIVTFLSNDADVNLRQER